MTIFLIIVSLYGGIVTMPMNSMASCQEAAKQFNEPSSRVARAHCVKQ